MTAVETSAVTWGGTELSYTIRRSPRRKKTVAVTVDPTGGILVVAPERVATERLDSIVGRKAEWIVRRIRRAGAHGAAAFAARVRQRRERALSGPALPAESESADDTGSAKLRGGWLHVPAGGGGQDPAEGRAEGPGCGRRVVPPAGGGAVTGTGRGVACEGRRPDATRQAGQPAEALGQL